MVLDLGAPEPQTLGSFEVGQNAELTQLLQRLALRTATSLDERFVYLWGAAGAGKSHLLQALAAYPATRYIAADAESASFTFTPDITLYLIDDSEQLSAARQIDAFNLFNQVREHGASLVASGAAAPAVLGVREDLRTRFGWGLIYQLHELTDDEKIGALTHAAAARGLVLSAGVLPYLITHFKRDMRSLSAVLNALDRYSLETKRPMTLALLRSLLELEGDGL